MDAVGAAEILLDPGIGQFRQDLLADVVQRDGEDRLFVAQDYRIALSVGGVAVAVREGDINIEGLAGLVAHDLVFKAVDEGTAAQRQAVAAVGAAGKCHAIHGAHIVDVDGVSVGGGTVGDLLRGGVLAEQAVDLGLHVLLRRLDVRLLQRDGSVVLRQGHIIQCADAGPVAVLVQTVTVSKVLVVIIRSAAVDRRLRAGRCGRGRRRLRAARSRQRQCTGAEKADCLRDDSFQVDTSCIPDAAGNCNFFQTDFIIKGKNEKEKDFAKFPQVSRCLPREVVAFCQKL